LKIVIMHARDGQDGHFTLGGGHLALFLGLALITAAISFGAIARAQAQTQQESVLRIGYQKYGTLVLLKARGTLEKRLAELDAGGLGTEGGV